MTSTLPGSWNFLPFPHLDFPPSYLTIEEVESWCRWCAYDDHVFRVPKFAIQKNIEKCARQIVLMLRSLNATEIFRSSVTRWLHYCSIFGHLQQWKLAQKCDKFAKVGSAFCQIRNKASKFFQWLVNFCQSGKISPNLCHTVQKQKQISLAFALQDSNILIFVHKMVEDLNGLTGTEATAASVTRLGDLLYFGQQLFCPNCTHI